MTGARRFAACCDIGGTKVLLGLIDRVGQVVATDRFLVGHQGGSEILVAEIGLRFRSLADQWGIAWDQIVGIGCSSTGELDLKRALVISAPTLPSWHHTPLKAMLEKALDRPTWLEMDAYAAALGEAWQGSGVGAKDFVYVVVGTGIGSGILVDGRPLRGAHGTAGEIGHTTVDPNGPPCGCGNFGCLEALASGPAIARRAQGAIRQGHNTLLQQLGQESLTAETVARVARLGDVTAQEILRQTGEYLGIGVATLVNVLDPEIVAFGGGVMGGIGDLLLQPIRRSLGRRVGDWVDLEKTRVVLATLGDEANLLGVAHLVWHGLGETVAQPDA